jgi:hypothetical protein
MILNHIYAYPSIYPQNTNGEPVGLVNGGTMGCQVVVAHEHGRQGPWNFWIVDYGVEVPNDAEYVTSVAVGEAPSGALHLFRRRA